MNRVAYNLGKFFFIFRYVTEIETLLRPSENS